jgi:hypothetical protein
MLLFFRRHCVRNKMNKSALLLGIVCLSLAFLTGGCGAKKVKLSEGKAVKSGVEVWANWLKDKGKKFDVQFNIHNASKRDVIIRLSDMSCSRGNDLGRLEHTFFNTGERNIDIRVNQLKTFNMVCTYGEKAKGDYKILISRIYDNPSSNGKDSGEVLATDLVWIARDAEER